MSAIDLHLLGTGNAFNLDGRASAAVLVKTAQGPAFLVDAGPTVGLSLAAHGVDTSQLDVVFFTHLHGDHIAGWPFLLLRLALIDRRTRPLDVVGPPGTRAHLQGLMDLCYPELIAPARSTCEVRFRELAVADARGIDCGEGPRFDTFAIDHHPTSLAYAFHVDGGVIGVSGDTRWCPALEALIAASDLLVLECTSVERLEAKHVCVDDLREHAALFRGRRTFLVHLDDTVAAALARAPVPGVEAGRDGQVVRL
jgi:ribonuclease BN (tRNA processing enzyme)